MSMVTSLDVCRFHEILCDVHSPVTFEIKLSHAFNPLEQDATDLDVETDVSEGIFIRWNNDRVKDFCGATDMARVTELVLHDDNSGSNTLSLKLLTSSEKVQQNQFGVLQSCQS